MNDIAIVIPAYKIDFFEQVLKSLSCQTNKEFNVYIGIDASPYDFESIISKYIDILKIKYVRFKDNLGGKNLVGQWTRCIDITNNERWIWLFSDDDIIGKKCVELFYNEINNANFIYDIYHFDVEIINNNGTILRSPRKYPKIINDKLFYRYKESAILDSFVVEYVFSREIYNKVNGFENFDLAWGSDIATWVKMSKDKGIKTIDGDFVYWRKSNKNITPDLNREMVFRKFNIEIDYFKWMNNFFNTRKMNMYNVYYFFRSYFYYSNILNHSQINEILVNAKNKRIIGDTAKCIMYHIYPLISMLKYYKTNLNNKYDSL